LRPTSQTLRKFALAAAGVSVAAFGVASVASYSPKGVTDRSIAKESLRNALAALNDETRDSTTRVVAYRDGLNAAQEQLRNALRVNPTDSALIERLAVVRWELGALAGVPDRASILSLVTFAADRAPRIPEIQANLGSLFYRMGNPSAAAPFMRRSLELSPSMTNRVVALMKEGGVNAEDIAATLPHTGLILALLREDLSRAGRISDWIQGAEALLRDYPDELIAPYTDACLESDAAARLLEHVEQIGEFPAASTEARRQIAIGRAQLALKAWSRAASAAGKARVLAPSDWGVLEFAGGMALAAGDAEEADSAFRDALTALAQLGGRKTDRARLYRRRGEALERLGRVDAAFDEYRRAADLIPDDPWLHQRFAASSPRARTEDRP